MGSRRSLLAAGVASLLACLAGCGDGASAGRVDPPDEPGAFAVGHTSFTAVDPGRGDRPIPVDVWYPVDPADAEAAPRTRYPLIPFIGLDSELAVDGAPVSTSASRGFLVFSHGYAAISTQSVGLMETLASHGFVVASPEHTGNAQFSGGDSFDEAAANRVPDVSFLIDTMLARGADPADAFHDRLDDQRVGVVGHSFGGMTAIGMKAGWAGAEPDPRVAAIAPISAVVDGDLQRDDRPSPNAGFAPEQLARIEVPVLLVGGTEDTNVPIENNAIAFAQMTGAPRVYKVDVIGANHTHFANICTFGDLLLGLGIPQLLWPLIGAGELLEPYAATCGEEAFPIEEAARLQNLYVVAFFKRHLLGERAYGRYLSAAHARREPAIELTLR